MKRTLPLILVLSVCAISLSGQESRTKYHEKYKIKQEALKKAGITNPEDERDAYMDEHLKELEDLRNSYLEEHIKTRSIKSDGTFVSESDSLALVALYNSTDGDNWTINTNWLIGPVHSWSDVEVKDGNVISLWLPWNNLVGNLPEKIGNLSNLTQLVLAHNQISGEIPASIGNIDSLEYLNLGNNLLTGSIPKEIGNLTYLTDIVLRENNLSGSIPKEIGNLENLEILILHSNQLTDSIPSQISNLRFLKSIDIRNNSLSGPLPPSIGNLANLESLIIWDNDLSGNIPEELGNLTKLWIISLSDNQLTGSIPNSLQNIDSLRWLSLSYNNLSGDIPPELGNLSNLEGLSLYGNQLSGNIPPEIGNLLNLRDLGIGDNQLTGSIPIELGNLDSVRTIHLSGNQLTGGIPVELGNLSCVTHFYINRNNLSGSIPTELSNLSNLERLELDYNNFTGNIPSEFGNLSNLKILRLSENQLSGIIPTELGQLSNLEYLELSSNKLTGSIPVELGNLTNLFDLNLAVNLLTGSIPSEIGNLTNLHYLELQVNQLFGSVPPSINNLVNLWALYLHTNYLTDLPDLSALSNQPSIALDYNYFTFGDLENLNTDLSNPYFRYSDQLDLDTPMQVMSGDTLILNFTTDGTNNSYQWFNDGDPILGEESDEIKICCIDTGIIYCEVYNDSFPDLTLSTNPIFINLEDTLGILTSEYNALVELYNSTNGSEWFHNTNWLSDELINTWYGIRIKRGHVFKITLIDNNLSGPIPSQIGDLPNLNKLFLSDNNLSGEIPNEIEKLDYLEKLYLRNNNLTGTIPSEIGSMKNILYINLESNELTGIIPPELGDLDSVLSIDLADNKLTGNIPPELGNLTKIFGLYFNDNQLSGSIPDELGNLSTLYSFNVNNNNLANGIPESFANLSELYRLNVANNQLSEIPDLSGLKELTSLYLDHNKFTFEDFENADLNYDDIYTFNYSPQDSLSLSIKFIYVNESDDIILNCDAISDDNLTCTNNQYSIYKGNEKISDWSDSPNYTIESFGSENEGKYTFKVRNPDYPELNLHSDTVELSINNTSNEINLSNNSISENSEIGTLIGTLDISSKIKDKSISFCFSKGNGVNDVDNELFTLDESNLKTATLLDFETKYEYHIYIRAISDEGECYYKALTINVTNENESPTGLSLSSNSIGENVEIGTIVGALSSIDPDNGDTFTYTLETGNGTNDTDNASFTIEGTNLKTATELDYETRSEYNIYVQVADAGGLTFSKAFVINVNDVTETGIDELSDIQILLYPNPSNGIFNINANRERYTIEIFDIIGNKLLEKESHSNKSNIDITDKPNGIYFVRIIADGQVYSQKIVLE